MLDADGGAYVELGRVIAVILKRWPSCRSSLMIVLPTFPPGYVTNVRYGVDVVFVPRTPSMAMFSSSIVSFMV